MMLQSNNIVIIYDIYGIYDMTKMILSMQYKYLKGILIQKHFIA